MTFFYRLLDHHLLYQLSQVILAPGGQGDLQKQVHGVVQQVMGKGQILDVGCGPVSWLWKEGIQPIGIDLSLNYTQAFSSQKGDAVTGSATNLPFAADSFAGVWSIGLFHHLTDDMARAAFAEMTRVTKPGGTCVILDAVLPFSAWRRPIPWLIRKLDRGEFMRSQENLYEIIASSGSKWHCERFSYSLYGLEAVICWSTL